MSITSLLETTETLLTRIWTDEDRHGGLLSRDTIRCADELRSLAAAERRRIGVPDLAEPDQPRQPKGAL